MKRFILLLLFTGISHAQKGNVAELQLKIDPSAEEELYYAFAAGDKIVFSIEETTGQTLGEVSVTEYPETVKYKVHGLKKEKNRQFTVPVTAVYKFRFANTDKEIRQCSVKIQRIPASAATKNFITSVHWKTVQDTVWNAATRDVVTGYDTLYSQKTRKVIDFERKYEELVLDKNQRVNAKTTLGESKTTVGFALPADVVSRLETKKVIAWAYWVGVGDESNEFWKQNRKMIVGAVQGAAAYFTTPLGGIAAGAATNLALPVNGEDVEYALLNEQNSKLFMQGKIFKPLDNGKGIAAYKRFTDTGMLQGRFFMALVNDNYIQPIDVNVKVSAIIEHIRYRDEQYTEKVVNPRYEKKIVREPSIVTTKIPVLSQ